MSLVTIVIMNYNEVHSLERVVCAFDRLSLPQGYDREILIIDDGSTDGSHPLAQELASNNERVRLVRHEVNKGLGGVYRTAFKEATGDLITFFPADGQFSPDIVAAYLDAMDEDVDLILGYVPNRPCSKLSKLLSAVEKLLYRLLFGKFPTFQGILMFRRHLLDAVHLKSDGRGWAVLMELIIRLHRRGVRVRHMPIEIVPREYGVSKVNNIKTIVSNVWQMIQLRILF